MNPARITDGFLGRRALLGAFVFAALLSGCASSGGAGGGGEAGAQTGALQAISAEEIASAGATDGWDLIQRLRPNWLSFTRGEIVLYVNGQLRGETGGVEQFLRAQPVSTIARVEWVRPEDATRLPQVPAGRIGGAILVTTRGGE